MSQDVEVRKALEELVRLTREIQPTLVEWDDAWEAARAARAALAAPPPPRPEGTSEGLKRLMAELDDMEVGAALVAAKKEIENLAGSNEPLRSALAIAKAELAASHERLEITHAYDGAGNKVPFPEGAPDGIECRDETIKQLERELAASEAARADVERKLDDAQYWRERHNNDAIAANKQCAENWRRWKAAEQSLQAHELNSRRYAHLRLCDTNLRDYLPHELDAAIDAALAHQSPQANEAGSQGEKT